ncbi:MAG: hypothetical protein GKR93_11430 [Gammaproteobacteria bacterium]|nr:hypothetical protein [Gammaproteobacteria bacterium]
MAITDLRSFLTMLEKENELVRVQDSVSREFEIAGYVRKSSDAEGPALLFENIQGSDIPVLGAIYNNRRLMLKALQTNEENAVEDFLMAMKNLSEPVLNTSGPCKDVVYIGDEATLDKLPIPICSELDSGPFITAGVAISKDIEDGGKNASIYRFENDPNGSVLLRLFKATFSRAEKSAFPWCRRCWPVCHRISSAAGKIRGQKYTDCALIYAGHQNGYRC